MTAILIAFAVFFSNYIITMYRWQRKLKREKRHLNKYEQIINPSLKNNQ
jgi:hypothetical protein